MFCEVWPQGSLPSSQCPLQTHLCIYFQNPVPQNRCRLSPATGIGYAKKCVFCCFHYFLFKFCVNINGGLEIRGGVCVEKALQGIYACCFLSWGFWYSLRLICSYAVSGMRTNCFCPRTDLSLKRSLTWGSGIMPCCFKEYSFWMQNLFNKIVLSSVWYYVLIITV